MALRTLRSQKVMFTCFVICDVFLTCIAIVTSSGRKEDREKWPCPGRGHSVYLLQNLSKKWNRIAECVLRTICPAKVNQSTHSAGPYVRTSKCAAATGLRTQHTTLHIFIQTPKPNRFYIKLFIAAEHMAVTVVWVCRLGMLISCRFTWFQKIAFMQVFNQVKLPVWCVGFCGDCLNFDLEYEETLSFNSSHDSYKPTSERDQYCFFLKCWCDHLQSWRAH